MLSGVLPEPVFHFSRQTWGFVLGALLIFGMGLWDDLRGIKPAVKLVFQILAALAAYWGGFEIGLMGHASLAKFSWACFPAHHRNLVSIAHKRFQPD